MCETIINRKLRLNRYGFGVCVIKKPRRVLFLNRNKMEWSIFTKRKILLGVVLYFFSYIHHSECQISSSPTDLSIQRNEKDVFYINIENIVNNTDTIQLVIQHDDILKLNQTLVEITINSKIPIEVEATGAGHCEVYANQSYSQDSVDNVFVRVTVYKNGGLGIFSQVIGWIYFVAWSVSFYPQIYINWKRKSVIGLNFDFLALNIVGFAMYSIFNLGLYVNADLQAEYSNRYPRGLNPVKINDVVFSVHAVAATILTILQCYMYERGEQRISITARIILGIFALFLTISAILAGTSVIHWLDFIYYCSYVKLTITLIKYIPQAYMNYKRKSTIGWSIGNIFLDFTGGTLSMLQMILDSYNYDDWVSIFGDPTKFGLGLFSVAFDIFFIIQHYILYRHTNYQVN